MPAEAPLDLAVTGATARVGLHLARRRRPQRRPRARAAARPSPPRHRRPAVDVARRGARHRRRHGRALPVSTTAPPLTPRSPPCPGPRSASGWGTARRWPSSAPRASSAPPTPDGAAWSPACCRPPSPPCGRSARGTSRPTSDRSCTPVATSSAPTTSPSSVARFGPGVRSHDDVGHGGARRRRRHRRQPGRGRGRRGEQGAVHGLLARALVAPSAGRPGATGHGRVAGGRAVIDAATCRRAGGARSASGSPPPAVVTSRSWRSRRASAPRRSIAAVDAGLTDVGENYAQELLAKLADVEPGADGALHRPAPVEQGARRWPASSTCGRRSTGRRSGPPWPSTPRARGCSCR